MKELEIVGTSDYQRRHYHRFPLQYPVRIAFHSGDSLANFETTSENVSKGGILLKSPWMIPLHTTVNLAMSVQGAHVVRPIRLVAEGRTVRLQPDPSNATFSVAVQFTQPVTEIGAHVDFVLVRPGSSEAG